MCRVCVLVNDYVRFVLTNLRKKKTQLIEVKKKFRSNLQKISFTVLHLYWESYFEILLELRATCCYCADTYEVDLWRAWTSMVPMNYGLNRSSTI